jgi:hypothetical protein
VLRGVFAVLFGVLRALLDGLRFGVFFAEAGFLAEAGFFAVDLRPDLAALRSGERRVRGERGGGVLDGDRFGDAFFAGVAFLAERVGDFFTGDAFLAERVGDRLAGDLRADFLAEREGDRVGFFAVDFFPLRGDFRGEALAGLFFGVAAAFSVTVNTVRDFTAPPAYYMRFRAEAIEAADTLRLLDFTYLVI